MTHHNDILRQDILRQEIENASNATLTCSNFIHLSNVRLILFAVIAAPFTMLSSLFALLAIPFNINTPEHLTLVFEHGGDGVLQLVAVGEDEYPTVLVVPMTGDPAPAEPDLRGQDMDHGRYQVADHPNRTAAATPVGGAEHRRAELTPPAALPPT
jgi:hypothetical protein